MPDQASASRSSMKHLESGRHHDAPERSASRAVGVAIVAGGLAFSVSLYPVPGESPTLKLTPPKHELSESPKTVDLEFVNSRLPDFSKLELPDLAKLAGLVSHTFPDLPVDDLLGLVKTYGLPDLVKSFELLQSVAPMMSFEPSSQSVLSLSGGGGGGGGGLPPALPTDVLPAWVTLLEYLTHNLPASVGPRLAEIITSVVQSLAFWAAPAGPLPGAQVFALSQAPVPTLTPPPVSARIRSSSFDTYCDRCFDAYCDRSFGADRSPSLDAYCDRSFDTYCDRRFDADCDRSFGAD